VFVARNKWNGKVTFGRLELVVVVVVVVVVVEIVVEMVPEWPLVSHRKNWRNKPSKRMS
jgi:hypothetical protein